MLLRVLPAEVGFFRDPQNTYHDPKGLLSPTEKQCRGCWTGQEQDWPLRSHCSWCLGRGGRVTVGSCALVGRVPWCWEMPGLQA